MTWKCKICQNRDFIAFNAHWGPVAFLVAATGRKISVAIALVILAAAKEIWDIKYETNHPFWPVSVMDFAGYVFGVLLGLWF
jgi:uncharacterized protein YfiM (DUF2279 family)